MTTDPLHMAFLPPVINEIPGGEWLAISNTDDIYPVGGLGPTRETAETAHREAWQRMDNALQNQNNKNS